MCRSGINRYWCRIDNDGVYRRARDNITIRLKYAYESRKNPFPSDEIKFHGSSVSFSRTTCPQRSYNLSFPVY